MSFVAVVSVVMGFVAGCGCGGDGFCGGCECGDRFVGEVVMGFVAITWVLL